MASYQNNMKSDTATIAISTTTSNAIDLIGYALCQIQMPATFTGTSITFQSSHDGSTYADVYDTAGNQVTVTVSASAARNINIAPTDFAGCRYLKIVGSSQAAARSIILISRSAF